MGNICAFTLIPPGVPTAAVEVTVVTETVIWSVSVEVMLVPENSMIAVFPEEVIVAVQPAPPPLPGQVLLAPNPAFRLVNVDVSIDIAKPRVTPAGTLLNVRRICVLFAVSLVSVDAFCVLVRQAEPNPSVMISDPEVRETERLVKIAAVPRFWLVPELPTAIFPIPAANPFTYVSVGVEVRV